MVKTRIIEIEKDLFMLRLEDNETRYFEGLWRIPEGITYNSYVLKTGDRAIVFDTWKHRYSSLFMKELEKIVDVNSIKYVVVHHMEPDHSGAIREIVKANPGVTVLGHPLSKGMIESFYGIKTLFKPVKDGEELVIGGYKLKFIYTPWLHWPETIMTYLDKYKILFTCDAFGAYSILDAVYAEDLRGENIEKYRFYTRKYIATVIGRYASFVEKALDKIESLNLDIRTIAPAHGLLWKNPANIMNLYRVWSRGKSVRGVKKVTVIYSSMYGFVEKAINDVIDVLRENQVYYTVYRFLDDERDDISGALGDIINSRGIIIGTATYEASIFPFIKYIVELIIEKIPKNKKVLIISNYGWGGVAGRKLRKLLEDNGFKVVDVIEFKAGELDKYREKLVSSTIKFIEEL